MRGAMYIGFQEKSQNWFSKIASQKVLDIKNCLNSFDNDNKTGLLSFSKQEEQPLLGLKNVGEIVSRMQRDTGRMAQMTHICIKLTKMCFSY